MNEGNERYSEKKDMQGRKKGEKRMEMEMEKQKKK